MALEDLEKEGKDKFELEKDKLKREAQDDWERLKKDLP